MIRHALFGPAAEPHGHAAPKDSPKGHTAEARKTHLLAADKAAAGIAERVGAPMPPGPVLPAPAVTGKADQPQVSGLPPRPISAPDSRIAPGSVDKASEGSGAREGSPCRAVPPQFAGISRLTHAADLQLRKAQAEPARSNSDPAGWEPELENREGPKTVNAAPASAAAPSNRAIAIHPDRPGPAPARSLEPAGTAVAKSQAPMQTIENLDEFSASTEKKLPVSNATATLERPGLEAAKAIGALPRPISPSNSKGNDMARLENFSYSPLAGFEATKNSLSTPGIFAVVPQTKAVECAHDLILLHTIRLRDSTADSLQVVIKPGGGMELSLDLQSRRGEVEVRAVLHQGDVQFLKQHWPELQQQLQTRGIRLGPLATGKQQAGAGTGTGEFSNPRRRATRDPAEPKGAFAEFVLAGVASAVKSAGVAARRGWELWA